MRFWFKRNTDFVFSIYVYYFSGTSFLTTLHGFPAATTISGMSRFTTLPAPITEPFPIVTPGNMQECPPIHTSSHIVTGLAAS